MAYLKKEVGFYPFPVIYYLNSQKWHTPRQRWDISAFTMINYLGSVLI